MRSMKQVCIAVILGLSFGARAGAAEFPANTPYYEHDAWFDITEWFDGNNYNPTDEAWWRWDDEKYDVAQDVSGDTDNDGWYGYTARDDNDWYYDYYDPYLYSYYDFNNDTLYEYGYRYYDFDKDGFYDAYAVYSDSDGDGLYEDFDYYTFNEKGSDQQKQQAQKARARQSKEQTITGTIQKTKLVKVRGGKQNVVIGLQPQSGANQQMVVADLGRAEDLKNVNPKLGDKITVKGPSAQVGKQNVVLAHSFDLNGKTHRVNRKSRTITAKVIDLHKAKIRGQEHLVAMVEPSQTGQPGKAGQVAVDLGPADQLKTKIEKGGRLTFTGFPVKVKDRPLIIAQSVQQGDQFVQINRQASALGGTGSTQQGQGRQQQNAGGSNEPAKGAKSRQP